MAAGNRGQAGHTWLPTRRPKPLPKANRKPLGSANEQSKANARGRGENP